MTSTALQRRAALVLHALDDADQHQILAALHLPQRQSIELLLKELRTLGIPTDPSLVDEVLGVTATSIGMEASQPSAFNSLSNAAPTNHSFDATSSMVHSMGHARLARELSDEPPLIVATLIHGAAWAEALLALMPPLNRRRVQTIIQSWQTQEKRPPTALKEAAQRAFQAHLRQGCKSDEVKVQRIGDMHRWPLSWHTLSAWWHKTRWSQWLTIKGRP
jgi:hypothetical protein